MARSDDIFQIQAIISILCIVLICSNVFQARLKSLFSGKTWTWILYHFVLQRIVDVKFRNGSLSFQLRELKI